MNGLPQTPRNYGRATQNCSWQIFKPDLRRSAITRVYNGAGWANVGAQVTAVLEDKSSASWRMGVERLGTAQRLPDRAWVWAA
jgi:hypothetical protein